MLSFFYFNQQNLRFSLNVYCFTVIRIRWGLLLADLTSHLLLLHVKKENYWMSPDWECLFPTDQKSLLLSWPQIQTVLFYASDVPIKKNWGLLLADLTSRLLLLLAQKENYWMSSDRECPFPTDQKSLLLTWPRI